MFISNITTLKDAIDAITYNKYYTFTDALGNDPNTVSNIGYYLSQYAEPVIYINGYFLVNDDLTFTDCIIRLGEQAEVHVKKGKTLRLTGCDIAGCGTDGTYDYTWRSIYADDETSKIIVENLGGTPTKIYDADTALNLSNRAKFNIINSEFGNNYHSIYFYNYMKDVDQDDDFGNIYGNTFSANALKLSPVGTLPYGLSGININYSEDITIGKAGEGANTFEDLYLGIDAKNANFHAYNNDFNAMQPEGFGFLGSCMLIGSSEDANDRKVVIGSSDSPDYANNFDNAWGGIITIGEQNVTIDGNNFGVNGGITDVSIGIYYNGFGIDKQSKTIQVLNNTIQNFSLGTSFRNITGKNKVKVNNNSYSDALITTGTDFNGLAINIQDDVTTNYSPGSFVVTDNTISNARIGIHAINAYSIKIGSDENDVTHPNTIHFDLGDDLSALTNRYIGIWLQHCDNAHVTGSGSGPDIYNNDPSFNTGLFRGINIENSIKVSLNCNAIDKISRSIYFKGICSGSLLRKNIMSDYVIAIDNNHSEIGDQGFNITPTDGETLDNEWTDGTNTATRIGGTLQNINWYWRNPTDKYDPNSNTGKVNPIPTFLGTPLCSDYIPLQRDILFGPVVGDSINFDENEEENSYLYRKNSFEDIMRDTSILTEERESDDSFHDFYNETLEANIGKFALLNQWAADRSLIDDAIELNESIEPDNGIEEYKQTVYGIYLSTIASGLPLSSGDSSTLEDIAYLNWMQAGDAIYMAAAMLGLEIDPELPELRMANNSIPLIADKNNSTSISVTPNPTSTFLQLKGIEEETAVVTIYNMEGGKVLQKTIKGDCNIDITTFVNGIYRIKVSIHDEPMHQLKFVVLKH